MAQQMQFNLRPVFAQHANTLLAAITSQIRQNVPKVRPDGRPLGASLPQQIRTTLDVFAAGFRIGLSQVGPKLFWFRRGTRRQVTRPFDKAANLDGIMDDVSVVIGQQMQEFLDEVSTEASRGR